MQNSLASDRYVEIIHKCLYSDGYEKLCMILYMLLDIKVMYEFCISIVMYDLCVPIGYQQLRMIFVCASEYKQYGA